MEHLTPDDRVHIKNRVPTPQIVALLLLSALAQEPLACDDCTVYVQSVLVARALRHDGRN